MKSILSVEFVAKDDSVELTEESVTLHNPEELLAFIAPNGGCDNIPSEVQEIRMVFLPRENKNSKNPSADLPATLQIGMVFFNGPLSEVMQTVQMMLDNVERNLVSESFLRSIGVGG